MGINDNPRAGHITLIRKFCDHTLDNSDVSIHNTVQEAVIVLWYNILLMINNFIRQEMKKINTCFRHQYASTCINAQTRPASFHYTLPHDMNMLT